MPNTDYINNENNEMTDYSSGSGSVSGYSNSSEYDSDSDNTSVATVPSDYLKRSRFKIAVCELYHEHFHGNDEPNGQFLVFSTTQSPATIHAYAKLVRESQRLAVYYNNIAFRIEQDRSGHLQHPLLRNYSHIITNERIIQPQIAYCEYLDTGEYIAVLKTFYISIIQRAWKKIYKQKQHVLALRKTTRNLLYRHIRGKWPEECAILPSLYGALRGMK